MHIIKMRILRHLSQFVLLTFCLSLLHPANLRTTWDLGLHFHVSDSGSLRITSHLFWYEFGPSPAYGTTAATVGVDPADPFIQAEAAALNNDPDAIFQFVRGLEFESYKGLLRGARGALWSEAGNAWDKASLMIALLRASGIPARYVQGNLETALAQELIGSMFPNVLRIIGCPPAGTETADPINGQELLDEARDHVWVEYDFGGQTISADPSVGASTGQTFAVPQGVSFDAAPESVVHKIVLRLIRELTSSFPGTGPDLKTVLDETFAAADLVGKPVSLGHLVSSFIPPALVFGTVTHTYSPYLVIGQSDGDLSNNPLIRGEDYQELLTNFPFGSQILTGLFLEFDVLSPGSPLETLERRTLVDKFGFVARNGGSGVSQIGGPAERPSLTPFDIVTASIETSFLDSVIATRQQEEILLLQNRAEALFQQIDGIDPTSFSAAQRDVSNTLIALNRDLLALIQQFGVTAFAKVSEFFTNRFARAGLVRAYFDKPRITLLSTSVKQDNGQEILSVGMDLLTDDIRAVPYPGQAADALIGFQVLRGLVESSLEDSIVTSVLPLGSGTGQLATQVSAARVFQAAQAQGVELTLITPEERALVDTLNISAEAKLRIGRAVSSGLAVMVPASSVQIDGKEQIAWFQVDPQTGQTQDVGENGRHQALTQYSLIAATSGVLAVALIQQQMQRLLFESRAGPGNPFAGLNGCGSGDSLDNLSEPCKRQLLERVQELIEQLINALLASLTISVFTGNLFGPIIYTGVILGQLFFLADVANDPPLQPVYVQLPNAAAPPITPDALPGVNVSIDLNTLFTLPLDGSSLPIINPPDSAELPTVFSAFIQNSGPSQDTFTIDIPSPPAGYEIVPAVSSITIPAGETAEVGLCVRPLTGLAAPGTLAPFSVDVESAGNPSVANSVIEQFSVPEVPSISLDVTPALANAVPGSSVPAALTLTNAGNVPLSNVAIDSQVSSGLSVSGLSPASLDVGESVVQNLTLNIGGNAPLNETLGVTFTPPVGLSPKSVSVSVQIVDTAAQSAADAALAAGDAGRPELGATLSELSLAMTALAGDLGNATEQSRICALLGSVLEQFNAVAFDPFIADLTAARDTICSAGTMSAIQTALNDVSGILTAVGETLRSADAFPFDVVLNPNSAVALPNAPTNFDISLTNTGTQTTAYNLSLGPLPPGITGSLDTTFVTLGPGEFIPATQTGSATVTITQPTQELIAFEFEVIASVAGRPGIAKAAIGTFTARNELIEVTRVDVEPAFGDPGDAVNISTRIFNAVNETRNFKVLFDVIDPNSLTIINSPPVTVELTVLSSLDEVDLGVLDTTGFDLGTYTVAVTVTDINDVPISGALARAPLLIGSPVTASLSVEQEEVPPCETTVPTLLDIQTTISLPPADIDILDVVDTTGSATSVVVDKDEGLAYVCGTQDVTVMDVSDPEDIQVVTTFATGISGFWGTCALNGDTLVVAHPIGSSSTKVQVYSLADPRAPVFVGSSTTPGIFLTGMFVDNDAAFVSTQGIATLGRTPRDLFGDFTSFDLSAGAPGRADALGGFVQQGWTTPVMQGAPIGNNVALVPTTTSDGTPGFNNFRGIGCFLIVDYSDPFDLTILPLNSDPSPTPQHPGTQCGLFFPETGHLMGVAVQGNTALVVGSSGIRRSNGSFNGTLVLITLDISDPTMPEVLQSLTTDLPAPGILVHPATIGDNMFAVRGGTVPDGAGGTTPTILLIDTSDPTDMKTTQIKVPTGVNDLAGMDGMLYTTSSAGLSILDLGSISSGNVAVEVQIPSGVTIAPSSFNIEPDLTVPGTDFDTFSWTGLGADTILTWESMIADLQPGEVREIVQLAIVEFVLPTGDSGQLELPPLTVVGEQILLLDPSSQTVQPGEPALYSVTLKNPLANEVVFNVAVQGISQDWVDLAPSITIPANTELAVPLIIQSDPLAVTGEYDFLISATDTCDAGNVPGTVILVGDPFGSVPDPVDIGTDIISEAHGCVLGLTPSRATGGQGTPAEFTVRATNTGNGPDTLSLVANLPSGFTGGLEQTSVDLLPGLENFRDITLTITPPTGASGSHAFSVTGANGAVCDVVNGTVDVALQGVAVEMTPAAGMPGSTFDLKITNTGQVADTFDVFVAGPLALFVSLSESEVSLNAGAMTTVTVMLDSVDFAFPGSLFLIAGATSQTDSAVTAADTAVINIPETSGLDIEFQPATITRSQPGSSEFLLLVHNLGNTENAYIASIMQTDGPVIASLTGLDNQPTQEIPLFRLPGTSTGAILLNAELQAQGQGMVEVAVTSLDDPALTDTAMVTIQTQQASGSCEVCSGTTIVVDEAIELDANNLAATAGVLAPFASFDGETILIDLVDNALHVSSSGRISVLAGASLQPAAFHALGNHGTPNLHIKSSCTLTLDPAERGRIFGKLRSLTGVIETNAQGGKAGDILLEIDGPVTVDGGLQSFQENNPDAVNTLSGSLTVESLCGDIHVGELGWIVTWGNAGTGAVHLTQLDGGNINVHGLVLNRTNKTLGDNAPPEINIAAFAGGVTIDGSSLVLDDWNFAGGRYDTTSGLMTMSREASAVGNIAIQARDDVAIHRNVTGLNLENTTTAAITTFVNSNSQRGGQIRVRSLEGSIHVQDRALQASGRGDNTAAIIELIADENVFIESPTHEDTQHGPTLSTQASIINGVGVGGTNVVQACDGNVDVAAGAEILAHGNSTPGTNELTADSGTVTVFGTVDPVLVPGPACVDPVPLF